MNSTANHGTTMPVFPSPVSVPRDNRDDSSRRNGASSITRSIFSITAAEPATSPTAPPATTTCATSWMVDPAYTPNACSPSPRCGYSHGYRNRSEEHTSELQSLMRISYAVFCLIKTNTNRYNEDQ